ncbi:hypothetical protein DFH09DRAFT_1104038 [Mycena vulgaris]|nr:hypothetical protein DFH09DRAFT_1104038 [Mycena vulgaris]
MDCGDFTFTFQVSLPTAQPPTSTAPATAIFARGGPSSLHASSQSRYRARNSELEKTKARERMRRLRENRTTEKEEQLRRRNSSQKLRASKTFAAFREYVTRFMMWVRTDDEDPQDVAAYNEFLYGLTQTQPGEMTERELMFLYTHVNPRPTTSLDEFRQHVREHFFYVVIANEDQDALTAYAQFIKNNTPSASRVLSDDDLEFLFRHVSPAPESIDDDAGEVSLGPEVSPASLHLEQAKLEITRARARERMSRRRATIKSLSAEVQEELYERARLSRAKYRAQHRTLLKHKEQSRRIKRFTELHGWGEYIKRKRTSGEAQTLTSESGPKRTRAS